MSKKWIPIVSLLILLGAGSYLWIMYSKSQKADPVVSERSLDKADYEVPEEVIDDKVPSGEDSESDKEGGKPLADAPFEIADLLDVSGHNASGSAKRRIASDETFEFNVFVENLPNPGEDRFYEVWLVEPVSLDYFAAGMLDLTLDGSYQLDLSSDDINLFSYSNVKVTLEAVDDGKPEEPILEGSF